MNIQSSVLLKSYAKDSQGNKIAMLVTELTGDGSTPVVQTTGMGVSKITGYNDDGTAIIDKEQDKIINDAFKKFMAQAIKKQKELTKANGIDPSVVNVYGAENNNKKG